VDFREIVEKIVLGTKKYCSGLWVDRNPELGFITFVSPSYIASLGAMLVLVCVVLTVIISKWTKVSNTFAGVIKSMDTKCR